MGNNTLPLEDTIGKTKKNLNDIEKKPILMYTIIDYGKSQKIQLINYVNDIKIIYNEFKNNLTKKAFLIIKKNMKENIILIEIKETKTGSNLKLHLKFKLKNEDKDYNGFWTYIKNENKYKLDYII